MKFTTCFVGAIGSARTAPPPNSSTADWLLRTNGNKLVSCCRRPYALIRSGGKCDCRMHVMPSYRGINLRITFSIWLILLSACLRWQKSSRRAVALRKGAWLPGSFTHQRSPRRPKTFVSFGVHSWLTVSLLLLLPIFCMGADWKDFRADAKRMEERIKELSQFGANSDGGVSRVAFSDADVEGRKYIRSLMEKAGLKVRVDAAGNIIGHREGRNPKLPVILFGSHIDSVPH